MMGDLRVGTSVGHGEDERLGVLLGEVLIGELLTVDRLATGTLLHLISMKLPVAAHQASHIRCHG
jgi:hypothetical protein